MTPERILLPIDIARCPMEAVDLVNGLGRRAEVIVLLLYVVNLNIKAPENRVFREHGREAQWYLDQVRDRYIHPSIATFAHIRTGKPAQQILAEAQEESVDLIILSTYAPS